MRRVDINKVRRAEMRQGSFTFNSVNNDLVTVYKNECQNYYALELNEEFIKVAKDWKKIQKTIEQKFI